mgnify:CR=1 FL=1
MTKWIFMRKAPAEGGNTTYVFHRIGIVLAEGNESVVFESELDATWRVAVLAAFKAAFSFEELQAALFDNSTPEQLADYDNCPHPYGSDEELRLWAPAVWDAMLTKLLREACWAVCEVIGPTAACAACWAAACVSCRRLAMIRFALATSGWPVCWL